MIQRGRGAVVITGASSGVGRATAHAFARRGADLALCARGPDALRRTADECRALGGRAVGVPTDVRDPDAVERLASIAEEVFGGIGVWVNNAGVGAVGRYWEVPAEAHRATLETNLFGTMHGSGAALARFLRRRRGVLVNIVSVGGFVPTPFASAYAASKFAVRGFTDSIRQEVAAWPGIHVCAVYPYFLDTPGVQHAGNYTGASLRPAPGVGTPEQVAEVVVGLARRPRREVVLGPLAKMARLGHGLAPGLYDWGLGRFIEAYLERADRSLVAGGAVEGPMAAPMKVRGGWRHPGERAAVLAGGVGLAAGLAAAAVMLAPRPAR